MFGTSTLLGISWLWWAIGTFGIVGTALFLWLAPAVLAQIVSWSLKFFIATRIGNIIAAAAIAFFVGDVNRSIYDQHQREVEIADAAEQQKATTDKIRSDTKDEVWTEIANQTAANTKIDEDVKEFTNALPPVPHTTTDNPFRVGDASCRLRSIAGYAGCEPEGGHQRSQGVPQARSEGAGTGFANRWFFRLPGLITSGSSGAPQGQ